MTNSKRGLSLFITASMAFTSLCTSFITAEAANAGLEAGEYTVPIASLESAAPLDAVKEAFSNALGDSVTVIVDEDGSAEIKAQSNHMVIALFGGSFDANIAWIDGAEVISTRESVYTDVNGNILDSSQHTQVPITVPDVFVVPFELDEAYSQDLTIGVDFMAVFMGKTIEEYSTTVTLTLDMDNAVQIPEEESGFGSGSIAISAGEYALPASLKNATNISNDSMAASCIAGGKLTVAESGTAEVTIYLQPVSAYGLTLAASDWSIYQSYGYDNGDNKAAAYTTNAAGEVDSITFALPDRSWDGVYVRMYIGGVMDVYQNAYLALDYANISAIRQSVSAPGEIEIEIPETSANQDARAYKVTASKLADPYWDITVTKDGKDYTQQKYISTKIINGDAVIGLVLYDFAGSELKSVTLKGDIIE